MQLLAGHILHTHRSPVLRSFFTVNSCVTFTNLVSVEAATGATAVQMLDRGLQAYHALWVCDEVRTDVAPVKLHALHHIQVVLSSSGLLHGHHALTPHTSHGITDQLSNLHHRTSRSAVAAYHTSNNRNCVQHIKTHHNVQAGHAAVVDMSTQGKCLGAGP